MRVDDVGRAVVEKDDTTTIALVNHAIGDDLRDQASAFEGERRGPRADLVMNADVEMLRDAQSDERKQLIGLVLEQVRAPFGAGGGENGVEGSGRGGGDGHTAQGWSAGWERGGDGRHRGERVSFRA